MPDYRCISIRMTSHKSVSENNQENSPSNHGDLSSADVSRRRFLTTATVSIAGLGTLGVGTVAAAPEEHDLYVQGLGPKTTYSFTVGGDLEKSTAGNSASVNNSDDIVGQSAHGVVSNGNDAYTFTGPLYSFDYDRSGGVQVSLDGEAAHVGNRPDNLLVIEGIGPNTSYSFTAGKNLEYSTAYGATADEADSTTGQSAHGAVSNGKDAYTFDGSLLSFDFDQSGGVNVTLNGEPAHVGGLPEHTVLIEGFGTSTDYEFVTRGDVEKTSAAGASVDPLDKTRGSIATGTVNSGKDAYTFNGNLQAFRFDQSGEIRVTVDGKPAHVGNLPNRVLEIFADGQYGTYDVSVSDSLSKVERVNENDDVNMKSASGSVSGYNIPEISDTYGFNGELTSISLGGKRSPLVFVNGDQINPDNF